MECNKTKEDVEKHYTDFYLATPNFLPVKENLLRKMQANLSMAMVKCKRGQSKKAKVLQSRNPKWLRRKLCLKTSPSKLLASCP